MHKDIAISFNDVSKVYRLFATPLDQVIHIFGLNRFGFGRKDAFQDFPALQGINFTIAKGERLGVVGRNGSGKTTLLKLITGNFAPTTGRVEVNGTVQALINTGLGMHPDFSGMDNIRSALMYNGLKPDERQAAIDDVVEFCELGEFIYQPVKTYSLGMQSRLSFATATAIKPDILVIDEIMGAGDAYFSAKSAHRMAKLARSGCTLLLVSHSMQQVLQFC